jgi:serine/threonine protein phosphatase PrpC
MGNLLGAPITEKETHEGTTPDGIPWAVSSMQGWRVHMEDAHIAEHRLYAYEVVDGVPNKLDLPGHAMFAVFDGHGGTYAAMYSGRNLCRVLSCQPKFVEYAKFEEERSEKEKTITSAEERDKYIRAGLALLQQALVDAFVDIDKEIASALKGFKVPKADEPYHPEDKPAQAQNGDDAMETSENATDAALRLLEEEGDSGTTACVVVLTPNHVMCANAGDSRAAISKQGNKAVPLSYDHKPDNEGEERRIRAAGGYVAGGRVEGDLAVSRGLGDYRFKNMDVVMAATGVGDQAAQEHPDDEPAFVPARPLIQPGDQKVSPIPDIIVQERNAAQDEFIIVACDGIWDVQTNYEAVQTIAELFKEGETSLGLMCEEVRIR